MRVIRAPRGPKLNAKSWQTEAPLRMLMNNLDPEVAKDPNNLIVYGGTGKAARNWECYEAIVKALLEMEEDDTLIVQSGKPVALFKTHEWAPRVLISNAMLVPKWADWEYFRELEERGLTMYGQMTAGSWIYIGTQGILQGTYETFAAVARKHFDGTLCGRLVLTAGLGEMGGAQPLAAVMNGGVIIDVEVDERMIKRRLETKYLEFWTDDIKEATVMAQDALEQKIPRSIGLLANAAETHPYFVEKGLKFDVVTDQTAAHDMLNGYIPKGYSIEEASELRENNPRKYLEEAYASVKEHVKAMLKMKESGSVVFEYGNNIRKQAYDVGVSDAFKIPGFIPEYIRPLFCEGKGPFRWVALSGNPEDIYTTDEIVLKLFPENKQLRNWIEKAQSMVRFQGLPARICWLGYGERHKAGLAFNEAVREGILEAPIVIGRDHLDTGSVASPYRETEGMLDGSDAIADWPILNALLNTASGATWVSVHHGGGVGIGYSIHAGMVIVCDGTKLTDMKLERVLKNDPGIGVVRHADAGYEIAIRTAKEKGIRMPMLDLK